MTSRPSAEDLIGQTPTYWVMDLTPPEEWDENPDPPMSFAELTALLAREVTKAFQWQPLLVGSQLHAAIQQHGIVTQMDMQQLNNIFQAYAPAVNAAAEVQNFLQEFDEEKHGTYTYKPYKNNLGVPAKKTNTGPPINPHARHGRGGKR